MSQSENQHENADTPLEQVKQQQALQQQTRAAGTPLEQVKEQQAVQQQAHDVEDHPDPTGEVPGASIPSDRRHHPQRQNNY